MSITYPDLIYTNFPDEISDSFDYLSDLSAEQISLANQYKLYLTYNDVASANKLLADNPSLKSTIINAEKIKVTGKKLDQKIYYHHSDYVGGLKETTLREKLNKKPEEVIELAVKGMLPKGPLGRQMYTKLHVYAGPEHNHAAQKPEVLTF